MLIPRNKSSEVPEAVAGPYLSERARVSIYITRAVPLRSASRSKVHLVSNMRAESPGHKTRAEKEKRAGEIVSQAHEKFRNISSVHKRRKLRTVPELTTFTGNVDTATNEW